MSCLPPYYYPRWLRRFELRHNSISPAEVASMVKLCGFESLDAMISATVPKPIQRSDGMPLGRYHEGMTESEFLAMFK